MNLTLNGTDLRGLTLRFENPGAKPVAVVRSYRPGFYASHDLAVYDASGCRLPENADVLCCGTPYQRC